jgi:Tripartite tricarboxylate transporter TctB family
MADTLGHSPDRSTPASTIRNSSAAIAVLLLALTPQMFELVWSLAAFIFRLSGGRDPAQVLIGHGSGLLLALPSLISGAGTKTALSSDALLALIYSYPLLAVAVFTLFVRMRAPQDYFGGIVLMAIALFALWASSDLQGMRGFSFGAGTAPRMFGVLLLLLGIAIAAVGFLIDGPKLATYHWRGPLFVSLGILSFAVAIRPMGVIFSALASFLISAIGSPETKWTEAIIVGICLTAFCSLLFPYALGLPLQMLPKFMIR